MARARTTWIACATIVTALAADARAADAPPAPAKKPDPADVLPPRPPTPRLPPPEPVPWTRLIEFGPDLAFVSQPASHDATGHATGVHYQSTFGFGAHLTWPALKHLQFSVYFLDSNQGLRFDPGALGLRGQITSSSAHTYSFGLRAEPMIPLGDRARGWVSVGIGWGRWDFPRMEVATGSGPCPIDTFDRSCSLLYERADNMAVFPLGLGGSFDVVRGRLAVVLEFSASIPAFQNGTAVDSTRAVDASGANRAVGGLPLVDVTLAETLGLSLVL
ncbi:MAG TPA: hypothetical protein VHB21_14395 [Minicystis sp.]|nr:hypothetical protein [Minicystis sp.]